MSLGETTEAVVVWHLCSLEKLLNMPCSSFLGCCPFRIFRQGFGIVFVGVALQPPFGPLLFTSMIA